VRHSKLMVDTFLYFRRVWGPRAAYHLMRARLHPEWQLRLISAVWLAKERIPYSGSAPSLNFKGLPQ
jgi:hypothetical protein